MVATYPSMPGMGMPGMGMNNGSSPTGAMPMAQLPPIVMPPSPEEILDQVDTHERDVAGLTKRMQADYDLYRLKAHVNLDPKTGQPLTGYAVYTSSAPKVFADKVISWLVLAELLVRVPHLEALRHKEGIDNLKERFVIGCLAAADERLKRRVDPSLRRAISAFVTVRGGYVGGRALLVNRPDGSSYPDICVWDPMHTHWGTSADGLEWAAYKIKMTPAQIRREYPGLQIPGARHSNSTDVNAEGRWLVDWYNGSFNTVLIDGKVVKPPTLHGSPRVPCFLTLVGPWPVLQSEGVDNLIEHVGESVYAGVRGIYAKKNDIMSIFLEIVARARRQPIVTTSADGRKTLPEDPWVEATEIAMRTGESVATLEMQKMAQETMAYLTAILGEEQRATLPYSSYGETPFQLSGFAITQLRQATETVLASRLEAIEDIYSQIANLLYDQFMTRSFSGMKLAGRDSNREYFNMTLTPDQLVESCDYTVKLASQLPQDNAAKWQQAQIAKDTGLLSDEDILNNVLEVQDVQAAIAKLKTQKAKQGLPEAQLYDLMMAAAERGEEQLAKTYLAEYMRLINVKMGIMPDQGGGPVGQPGQNGKGKGMTPDVLPNAATGAAPQPETSNDGPSRVAPGTPRPGAQGQRA